jgi:hypothetical protein
MRNKSNVILAVCVVALLAVPAMGQKPAPAQAATYNNASPPQVLKVIHIKYADVNSVFHDLLIYGVPVARDTTAKIITVRGSQQQIDAIEKAVQQLDVPPPAPRSVEITAYMLIAAPKPGTPTKLENGDFRLLPAGLKGASLPAGLGAIVDQLERTSGYTKFRLVRSLTLRTLDESSGSVTGLMPTDRYSSSPPAKPYVETVSLNFNLSVDRAQVTQQGERGSVILRDLRLIIFRGHGGSGANINTSADVPQGEDVVVGNTDVGHSDTELFLVVSAKVTD